MNDREKRLIIILFGAAFLIVSLFLFTNYQTKMKQNKAVYQRNADDLERMKEELVVAESNIANMDWLAENSPKEGVHSNIAAALATFTEKSALKNGITIKKRPSPLNENTEEGGSYRTAVVSVKANAMDNALYRWLLDLQSPAEHRSITALRIEPQRDDDTRVDFEVEITQWFLPESDTDLETEAVSSSDEVINPSDRQE